jgi:hypothetical protein
MHNNLFHVYIDDRGKGAGAAYQLKIILNNGLASKEHAHVNPIRHLEFMNSKKSNCLQLCDVLTGAIAYELNGHIKAAGASEAKSALSKYIVRDYKCMRVVGNIIDGTTDRGRCTVRPFRR